MRKQCEKDRLALLSQMKVLESELEEQLSRQQTCAQQAEELTALRQQLESLDKHLRSQRQFMDVSCASFESPGLVKVQSKPYDLPARLSWLN